MFSSFYRPTVQTAQPKSQLSHAFGRYLRKHIAVSASVAILATPALSYSETIKTTNDHKTPITVVSSIKPIQLLVQTIAGDLTKQGVIKNQLLLPAGTSPHDYAMRFSDTKKLQQADVIFWVGENLETFLSKPLKLNKKEKVISFNNELNTRDTNHTQKHNAKISHHSDHKGHGSHHNSDIQAHQEPHPWLSPFNALRMAEIISAILSKLQPSHAAYFSENLHIFTKKMINLELSYRQSFGSNINNGFIVYHDAYTELVDHFKLNQIAVVTPMAGRNPKLRHVLNLKKLVEQGRVNCIIIEPNANTKILSKIIKNNKGEEIAKFIVDPIASSQTVNNTGFYQFYDSVLSKFKKCINK